MEAYFDEYDYYNFDDIHCHTSGKGRSKKEIAQNQRFDPNFDVRSTVTKYRNTEMKRKEKQKKVDKL